MVKESLLNLLANKLSLGFLEVLNLERLVPSRTFLFPRPLTLSVPKPNIFNT